MAGRGPQSFQKKLKEQQRKEKQQEKIAKRLERKRLAEASPGSDTDLDFEIQPQDAEAQQQEAETQPQEAERS